MTDNGWIASTLTSARPQVLGALLRYFRDLDVAEEAFQEASLRALKHWTANGPPRDPAAWLILVGRNSALDEARRRSRQQPLPDDDIVAQIEDPHTDLAERLDDSHYRDDVLRLMFICCHPDLPATQQIALALRMVSGLTVKEIARAFLVERKRNGTAHHASQTSSDRRERAVRNARRCRAQRTAGAVAAMIYCCSTKGIRRAAVTYTFERLCAKRRFDSGACCLRLFQSEPEIMGLLALLLLQHARTSARIDAEGNIVLLEDQDRICGIETLIAEGLVLVDKALRHRRPAHTNCKPRSPPCTCTRNDLKIRIGPRSTSSTKSWSNSNRRRSSLSIERLPCRS